MCYQFFLEDLQPGTIHKRVTSQRNRDVSLCVNAWKVLQTSFVLQWGETKN